MLAPLTLSTSMSIDMGSQATWPVEPFVAVRTYMTPIIDSVASGRMIVPKLVRVRWRGRIMTQSRNTSIQ